jgi:hypothetical protein
VIPCEHNAIFPLHRNGLPTPRAPLASLEVLSVLEPWVGSRVRARDAPAPLLAPANGRPPEGLTPQGMAWGSARSRV